MSLGFKEAALLITHQRSGIVFSFLMGEKDNHWGSRGTWAYAGAASNLQGLAEFW
jgi:hypothetical protein